MLAVQVVEADIARALDEKVAVVRALWAGEETVPIRRLPRLPVVLRSGVVLAAVFEK